MVIQKERYLVTDGLKAKVAAINVPEGFLKSDSIDWDSIEKREITDPKTGEVKERYTGTRKGLTFNLYAGPQTGHISSR